MIKIACSGFPVGKKFYESKLHTVELDPLTHKLPRPQTIEKWRAEAPKHFDFIVCASRLITHAAKSRAQHSRKNTVAGGGLIDTASVRQAYAQTLQIAETLKSRMVLFQLPSHFTSQADNIQRVQRFFSQKRGEVLFAWEAPMSWPAKLIEDISNTYRIMPAMNPLGPVKPPLKSPMRYYRLGGKGRTSGTGTLTETDLKKVKALCDTPLCYVVFNNGPTAFDDAVRFSNLC